MTEQTEQEKPSVKTFTPGALATQVVPFTTNANKLTQQAEAAVIDSMETFETAVDFIKICTTQLSRLEDMRTQLVKPLNDHVKWINGQFAPIRDSIEAAKAKVNGKATTWKVAEDARIAEEARKAEEAHQAQLLEAAESAEARGEHETADAVLDLATTETKAPKPTVGRGSLTGASGSVQKRWVAEVEDPIEACKAIGNGELPIELIKEWAKSRLNQFAKEIGEKSGEGNYHGIKVFEDKKIGVK